MTIAEYKAYTGTEFALQSQCEEYLDWLKLPYIRIPDLVYSIIFGGILGIIVPAHLKQLVARKLKGIPDITILVPQGEFNTALCIELKVKKNKLSQGQKNFSKRVNVLVIRSFDEFKEVIERFTTNNQ